MANNPEAIKQPVSKNPSDQPEQKENLIELEEISSSTSVPNELNNKIGKIDADLNDLRNELKKTNLNVKTSLSQLSDKEGDLTTKVSETYQQLGMLDEAYKVLSGKSTSLSKDIKDISKQINQISAKTDSDVALLNDGYKKLITRTDELTQKSKQTTQALNKSIKDNTQMLKELETALVKEIDTLAKSTQERDQELADRNDKISRDLNQAEEDIKASQARMLKLQAVDQALEKRVTHVEESAEDLTKKSRELSRSTTLLNKRSAELSDAIDELRARSEVHDEQISDLQAQAAIGAQALKSQSILQSHHFKTLSAVIGLLAIALLFFIGSEYLNWESASETNTVLKSDISTTGDQLVTTQSQLSQLGKKAVETQKIMQSEITHLNERLMKIGDQVDTLDGRVTNMGPQRTFGNGNVIRGADWISKQHPEHHTIHLATLDDKQEMYKLAERYHTYLKDDLAYLPVNIKGSLHYALIYGNYSTETDAESSLSRLPRMIQRQRPSVHTMERVQTFINQ
jgi:chromosome segregation ATPase